MRLAALAMLLGCAHAATVEGVARPGALVIFGELHGTNEIPALFGDVVERAAKRGRVHVGLELPGESGAIWTDPFQSGRTSKAMRALIARLHALGVDVFWFDSNEKDRDGAMADNISAARAKAPQDLFLVLVGNLHARKQPGAPWDADLRWMAVRLAGREPRLFTFDARYAAGTAFICQGNTPDKCAATKVGGMNGAGHDGYDGTYHVGAVTASSPASSEL
ncbi:MAG TPA: hypothetical protein VLW85_18115 [Myxococcales bacterium]|nr:hypothetical protein [Myxococcales bacterium]